MLKDINSVGVLFLLTKAHHNLLVTLFVFSFFHLVSILTPKCSSASPKNEIHDIGFLDLHWLFEQLCQLTYLRQWLIQPKSHHVTFDCYYYCCELLIVFLQSIVLFGTSLCQRRLAFRYSLFIDIKFEKRNDFVSFSQNTRSKTSSTLCVCVCV